MAFDVNSLGGKLSDNKAIAEALSGSGGGDVFVVHLDTVDTEEETLVTPDKSASEIIAAFNDKKYVVGLLNLGGEQSLAMNCMIASSDFQGMGEAVQFVQNGYEFVKDSGDSPIKGVFIRKDAVSYFNGSWQYDEEDAYVAVANSMTISPAQ